MISDNKQLRIYNKQGKFVRSSVDELIAKKLNYWKNWNCSAGIRSLYIDYDGNIFICNKSSIELWSKQWGKEWSEYVAGRKREIQKWEMDEDELKGLELDWKEIVKKSDFGGAPEYVGHVGGDINFPTSWYKCPFDICACGADVIISKSKTKQDEEHLSVTKHGYDGQFRTIENKIRDNSIEPAAVEMDFPIPYQILWDITRRCNYNCSYCWTDVHNKTDKFIRTRDIIDTCERLIFEWAGGEEIRFNFGGGEPTLHPHFIEIIKYLKLYKQFILVTSNGSGSPVFWKEAVRYINSINLSAHFESINKKRFLENLTIILDWHDSFVDDHWIEVKLMAPPGKVNEAIEFKHQIEKIGRLNEPGANKRTKGMCSLVPVRDISDSGKLLNYSDEELKWFQNQ